jgi:hypothetical protein
MRFYGFSLIKWAKSINEPDPALVIRSSWERRILMMPKGGEAELLYIDLDDDVAVVRAGDWINPKEFGEKDSDGLRRWLKDKVAPCYWYPGGSGRIVGCTSATYFGYCETY